MLLLLLLLLLEERKKWDTAAEREGLFKEKVVVHFFLSFVESMKRPYIL